MKPPLPSTVETAAPALNLRYILLISLVAAFGGFLFGYDTAVVSGAIGFLQKHFQLSADLTGWAASSLLVGCMAGAMLGGPMGDRFGRKRSLIFCAALFAVSSLASAMPHTLGQFAWSRFAGGVAIGAASMLSPLYIAEISPEKIRGTLVALYQLAIVVGILIVFFVNSSIGSRGSAANQRVAEQLLATLPAGILADTPARVAVRQQTETQIERY